MREAPGGLGVHDAASRCPTGETRSVGLNSTEALREAPMAARLGALQGGLRHAEDCVHSTSARQQQVTIPSAALDPGYGTSARVIGRSGAEHARWARRWRSGRETCQDRSGTAVLRVAQPLRPTAARKCRAALFNGGPDLPDARDQLHPTIRRPWFQHMVEECPVCACAT